MWSRAAVFILCAVACFGQFISRSSGSSGSGSFVLVETKTASASASLDFTSCITSTYDSYVFDFVNVLPATDNQTIHMRVSTDGGSNWLSTSIYNYANYVWKSSSAGAGGSTGTTSINLLFNNVDADTATPGVTGRMYLHAPGSAVHKHVTGQFTHFGENSSGFLGAMLAGRITTTSAVNAVQFYFASGNIASGVIRCYGVAK